VASYATTLFRKYKSKGVLIDTNLLLLLVVGTYSMQRVLTFKRTQKYTIDDLDFMFRIIPFFERRFTTANILTEVDNLIRQLPEEEHEAVSTTLSELIASSFEIYVPAADVVQHGLYVDLGLTDCVTVACADERLVLTDDFRLSNTLSSLGRDSLNINHIRSSDWV
jgi:hypothetical protein